MRITLKFAPKLPAPRVMWAHPKRMIMCSTNYDSDPEFVVYACIPFPSRKAAESARKFWALTPEERVERLARAMQKVDGMSWEIAQTLYRVQARACLAAMGGGTK